MNSSNRFWFGVAAILILFAVVVGAGSTSGAPLDPRSVDPDGAKALVDVLDALGVEVTIDKSVPGTEQKTALLLRDRLSPDDKSAVNRWVSDGGTLVVADPISDFAPNDAVVQDDVAFVAGQCSIDALRDASQLRIEFGILYPTIGEPSCFGDTDNALVVTRQVGEGTVVAIGGQELFTNRRLDDADEAVVAVGLLAPAGGVPGSGVAILGPSVLADGQVGDPGELLAPRVTNGLIQMLVAFVLYALYRGRRFGRVVAEPLPVPIESSELVLRVGQLNNRSKSPSDAAKILVHDFTRRAARAIGIDPESSSLADAVEAATGHPISDLLQRRVTNDADLVSLAQDLDQIDRVLHRPEPTPEGVRP